MKKLIFISFVLFTFTSCKVGKHIISKEEANEMFTNEHSQFLEIGDTKIHYRDEGEGKPVLLIHGFGSTLHTWEKIKPELLDNGFRAISLDLPGFGLTDYPSEDTRVPRDVYFEYMAKFVTAMQLNDLHVVGNSMGGWIAWEMASQYPEAIDKLVLIDAAGYDIEETNAKAIKNSGRKIFKRFAKTGIAKWLVKSMVKQSYGDKKKVTDELVDFYYSMANREGNIASSMYLAQNIVEPESEKIKHIKNETLILWGSKDKLINVRDAAKFSKDLENDEVIIYQGVGHTPMEENHEQCAVDMVRFFNK